ncbi:Phosphatidylinositol-4-phosphate 5-kinase [Balamuthia mandrillaris]
MGNTQCNVDKLGKAMVWEANGVSYKAGSAVLQFGPESPFLVYKGDYQELSSNSSSSFLLHGHGTMTWKNGSVYKGFWRNNQRHGDGIMTFHSHDRFGRLCYDGQWKHDMMHGEGVMLWRDGSKYVGDWRRGQRCGLGVQLFSNGQQQYEGQWKGDKEDGQGAIVSSSTIPSSSLAQLKDEDGIPLRCSGEWRDGVFHGRSQCKRDLLSMF